MLFCYNCGSLSFHIETIKRKYFFKTETYWIPIQIERCENCGDINIIDTERSIIKKIYKAYSITHNLPSIDELRKFMSLTNMNCLGIDQKYNLPKGSTAAMLHGIALINNDRLINDLKNRELG